MVRGTLSVVERPAMDARRPDDHRHSGGGWTERNHLGRVRNLIASGAIDVCNFDASWGGGPTQWRRIAGLASAYGVRMAHHPEPQNSPPLPGSISHRTSV